jgi:hypothetical protein
VGVFDNLNDAELLKERIDNEIKQGKAVRDKYHEINQYPPTGSKDDLLEELYFLEAATEIEEVELNRDMYLQKLPLIVKEQE